MKIKSINPYTEELNAEIDLLTKEEIMSELNKSKKAFKQWSETEIKDRIEKLKKLSLTLIENKQKYAELITKEMGKPIKDSIAEVEKCALLTDYYVLNSEKFLQPEIIITENKSYVVFEPLGILFAIMPWNFPFWQAIRAAVPAIAAGNVVLLKHASNVPLTALAIEEAFKTAGFSKNIFKTLIIDSKNAMDLIEHVDAVTLTGSNKAGEAVGSLAGKHIKPIVLELGGSDPFIVLDDADLDKAAEIGATSRLINTGQSCIAAKRFIVMESVAEKFSKKFIEKIKTLKVGDPMDPDTDIGPIAKKEFADEMKLFLQDAKNKNASIYQDDSIHSKGYFFNPSVCTHVTTNMKIMSEEVFGPIAPIITVKTIEEAIKVANDTEFGLGASIWSKDINKAEKIARKIQSGFVAINDYTKSNPKLPFGGIKKSGVGREMSHYGLKEFVNIKTIIVKE